MRLPIRGPGNRIERILVRRSPESPVFADFSGDTIAKAGTWRLQADGAVSYSPFERKQKPESRRIRRTILLQGEGRHAPVEACRCKGKPPAAEKKRSVRGRTKRTGARRLEKKLEKKRKKS